jgi:hypothetical protein
VQDVVSNYKGLSLLCHNNASALPVNTGMSIFLNESAPFSDLAAGL